MTWGADVVTRRLFVMAAALALVGCTIDKQNAPAFSGPSEFSLAISATASPDIITPDGSSAIVVTVLDASSNPVAGLGLRFRFLGAVIGSLSTPSGTTDGAGRASLTYFGPGGGPMDSIVTIEILPVGTNAQNARARTIAVRVRT